MDANDLANYDRRKRLADHDARTVDITPTWRGVLRLLVEVANGDPGKARDAAWAELHRMADLADEAVASAKAAFDKSNTGQPS